MPAAAVAAEPAEPAEPAELDQPDEDRPAGHRPRAIGWLTVNAQPWAYVTIDGKRLASPTPVLRHPLKSGRHQVHLSSPSLGADEVRIIEVHPGRTTTLFHQFSPR
jgi:hypothetical protein